MNISPEARQEIVSALRERYAGCTRREKRSILDEFVSLTGYHRKHAIRLLSGKAGPLEGSDGVSSKGSRARIYDEAVREALIVLWEASDRICGKRLRPLLPVLVDALERHNHLDLDPDVRRRFSQ